MNTCQFVLSLGGGHGNYEECCREKSACSCGGPVRSFLMGTSQEWNCGVTGNPCGQNGCRHVLCLKSPDDSTLQPELRIAVLRAVHLETGMPS